MCGFTHIKKVSFVKSSTTFCLSSLLLRLPLPKSTSRKLAKVAGMTAYVMTHPRSPALPHNTKIGKGLDKKKGRTFFPHGSISTNVCA
jgi:hypothetical protein